MLNFEPSIVLVDDKPSEVEGIVTRYREEGFGVKYFNAHISDGENPPVKPYSDVNLIFLDVYLRSIGLTDTFEVGDCCEWVMSILPENTFYVLVIWSSDPHHKDDILEYLKQKKRSPYFCIPAAKADFKNVEDNSFDFDNLYKYIENQVKLQSELEELALWKRSVKRSSNVVIGHLAKDVEPEDVKKKLQKIIVGHGGSSFISNDRPEQKRDILFDALDKILTANAKGARPEKEISENNKAGLYSIDDDVQMDIDSKLNSWFHFNVTEEIDADGIVPGLICTNNYDEFSVPFSIQDDPKLAPKLREQSENDLSSMSDIVVVLNRPCDIAQNKFGKNVKLLSGVLINNPKRLREEDLTSKQRQNRHKYLKRIILKELPDSSKLYDHLYFSDSENDIAILLDFRYVFSVPEGVFKTKFENIKIFNKELMSEIQVEYSAYSSRLGITQII